MKYRIYFVRPRPSIEVEGTPRHSTDWIYFGNHTFRADQILYYEKLDDKGEKQS